MLREKLNWAEGHTGIYAFDEGKHGSGFIRRKQKRAIKVKAKRVMLFWSRKKPTHLLLQKHSIVSACIIPLLHTDWLTTHSTQNMKRSDKEKEQWVEAPALRTHTLRTNELLFNEQHWSTKIKSARRIYKTRKSRCRVFQAKNKFASSLFGRFKN